mmetsp:Transcript_31819/g.66883  ORF Transcript_31819/g.66883 Transcript_31819/m.66883 type:complete len:463 (+) Transcript_31819:25-1413(+)
MSLPNVPSQLTIRILYSDSDLVVVDKPCNLRSVPGHANPPPQEKERPRSDVGVDAARGGDIGPQSHRRTAQEAWVKAIQLTCLEEDTSISTSGKTIKQDISMEDAAVKEVLRNLGSTASPSCVPRKLETFVKYCHRNSKRLLPSFPDLHNRGKGASKKEQCEPTQKKQKCHKPSKQSGNESVSPMMRNIAQKSYTKISYAQIPLMNLPKPTENWESAIGQLRMLGFGDCGHCVSTITEDSGNADRSDDKGQHQPNHSKLHVVHRLDCQTSGIMVVARNHTAASSLCKAWRERELVQKVYLAHVRHWPPYHQHQTSEGTIDLPLAPSRTERIKWEVRPAAEGGKESKTYWKVYKDLENVTANNDEEGISQNYPIDKRGIILELHPITGRTHQLRLHCAAIGSGIVGDSLYGDSPIVWLGDNNPNTNTTVGTDGPNSLRLHAHKLTLPHPQSGKKVTFESPKPW